MNQLQLKPQTEAWIATPWEDYLKWLENPDYATAKGYYYRDCMRLEMLPTGFDHSTDHALLQTAISLYGILNAIPLRIADACTFRKTGIQECQPDIAVYTGKNAQSIPKNLNIVHLDHYPAPNLTIEISKTTLLDDLGIKRTLYEEMGAQEYWVVDVEKSQIIAYTITNRGSHRIDQSAVLPNLTLSILENALRQSKTLDHSAVGNWLLQQFSPQT